MSILDREHTVAPPGYNRWLVPPAALAVHLSIGQVYAFSVLKDALRERFDASHTQIGVIFSISIVMLGLSAAFGGRWMERHGPRKTMVLAAVAWSTGFAVGALGVSIGQLWVVYLGYGVIGGIGLGLGYISPVSTLIKWFPDRPGLATGLAIMGFGGGAMLAAPLTQYLLGHYAETESEALVPTLLTLGGIYAVLMLLGAAVVRVPPKGYTPEGWEPSEHVAKVSSGGQVSAKNAIKTFSFWMLWIVLFTNVTAGIGILENAKPMIEDYFPAVTAAAAAGFVGLLSLANMGGRIGWSSFSDVIGRKVTYMMYLGVGAVAYTMVALFGPANVALFVVLVVLIISFYGGGFATIPAYLKDVFGEFEVGAIHGRLLTAWSAAGVAGPLIINGLLDLLEGQGLEGADLYRPSLLVMVGVLVIGFIANLLVRPVSKRWHEHEDAVPDHEKFHANDEAPALAAAGKEA
ncbi:OFA family MFS transporter [Demequina sp.]|uniref:L-lactate MFS transporter n=1 Tax=Demequina sp. TaxID=2050685 RepID=UPI0025DC6958|nr:OFA family MFS transporter [Demequina sp.]